jgi:probable HAF family extracellular repeat protein
MKSMFRSRRSTLTKTLVPSAFALSMLVTAALTFADQESGAEQERRGHQNELTFTQIDFPGALGTDASSINERGQIVGSYADSTDCLSTRIVGCHGYLLDHGDFTTIDVPAAMGTVAGAINRRGQIVGFFIDATGAVHGFLLDQGVFTPIDVLGATATLATEINDRGEVVGTFLDAGGAQHGFVLDKDVFTPIDFPGATGTAAFGINNRGQIVGYFFDAGGVQRGFVAECDRKKSPRGPMEKPLSAKATCGGYIQAR